MHCAGVYVTVYLGSVFRAVLTVTLSGLIWALDIALFYSPLGHRVFGEPLDPQVLFCCTCLVCDGKPAAG